MAEQWIALGVLTFARTAMGFQFQSIGALAPLLVRHLGVTNAEIGVLIGIFSIPGVFLALPGGILGMKFGDRRVVVTGLVLMTVGSATIGVADSFTLTLVGRLLCAIGAVLINVLITKMVTDWFAGRQLVWAMTVMINAWPVGIGLALLVLPGIAVRWNLATAFHCAAGAAAVGALVVAAFYRSPERTILARSVGLGLLSRHEIQGVSLAAVPWMLYNAGYAIMLGFVPAILVRGGWSMERAGSILGLLTFLVIVSVQAGGAMAQWSARQEAVVTVGLVAFVGMLLLLPKTSSLSVLVPGGLLAGLPAGALVAAPAAVLTPPHRGPGMGLFYTWYYAGMTILPPVAGRLQDVIGGAAALYFAAAAIALTLPIFLVFKRVAASRPQQADLDPCSSP